jgi:uncharacterized repeat protein (TIGR01451 family)
MSRMKYAPLLLAFAPLLPLHAQTVPANLQLTPIANGLTGAVGVRHAGDDSGRRFVIRRQGRIEIINAAGSVLGTPFLDLTVNAPPLGFTAISDPEGGDERGLLGLAFHPLYASNGRVFVYYIDAASDTVVAEYTRLAGDPNRLDPASARVILRIYQPATNHNGGDIHFGADGYLYVGMGDGGGSNDQHCNAGQGLKPADLFSSAGGNCTISGGNSFLQPPPAGVPRGNANSRALLGKMLRIDVDISTPRDPVPVGADLCAADTDSGIAPYDIPPDNPFAGDAGSDAAACDETYHYGLRNPFRFSFDRLTHDLIIGDVGQNRFEEVDLVSGAGGLNFGWNPCEGFNQRGSTTTACAFADTDPILAYGRSLGFSITGGFRYRGPHLALQGLLFFGDFGNQLFAAEQQGGGNWIFRSISDDPTLDISAGSISGFGEDEAGHLYVTTLDGSVRRFDLPVPLPQLTVTKNASLTTDTGVAGVADAGDVITYAVTVLNSGAQTLDALAVSDSFEGGAAQALSCAPLVLAPGASATCISYTHAVTQDEVEAGGTLDNVASASADDEGGDPVSDSDDAIIAVVAADARLTIDKTATLNPDNGAPGVADAGDVIRYSVSVTNSGNVRLANLGVIDSFMGGTAQALTCAPTTLQPGQQASCTAYQHAVTQAEIDAGVALSNLASASATRVGGGPAVQGSDQTSIAVVAAAPSIAIDKSAQLNDGDGDALADAGETIAYSFSASNTGNVTLSGVQVQDARLGGAVSCAQATLAPGASTACGPVNYTVLAADLQQATIVNSATAQASAPGDAPVQSSADTTATPTDRGALVFRDGFED